VLGALWLIAITPGLYAYLAISAALGGLLLVLAIACACAKGEDISGCC
jgi:hypothetical protein